MLHSSVQLNDSHGAQGQSFLRSLPQLQLDATRQQILEYFENSWALTEMLFSGLKSDDAYYRRPYHQLRHPMIFYYGHPVALYINKLRVAGLITQPVDAALEASFEVGVDEMRWDDLHDGAAHVWPKVDAVRVYRAKAFNIVRQLIETHPLLEPGHPPISQSSPLWALVMAFEHERIHLETSSVLIRELPIELVQKPVHWPASYAMTAGKDVPVNAMLSQPASEVSLGKPVDWLSFGWDNEYGNETRSVRAFAASRFLISNGEFLAFVKDGGYREKRYWSREGWAWRSFRNIKWPSFWVQDGPAGSHQYKLRTIFEVIDMQANWPVCANSHEAKAYCAWASERDKVETPYRLLTEAEHHAIRDSRLGNGSLGISRETVMNGNCLASGYNMNLETGNESPVDALSANDKGFHDTFGNVWQWCEDHFHPLDGAKPHPYYDDFSAPCYDGEHQMILGGSFISTGDLASIWARFHFRPHFFQHVGFRLARSTDGNPASGARVIHKKGALNYQTREMLDRYMLMHWGKATEISAQVPLPLLSAPQAVHLPITCAEIAACYAVQHDRALDLGCAVARSSFEMARQFKEVIGVDYSEEFVAAAQSLQRDGTFAYHRKNSGAENTPLIACVDSAIDRSRLRFEQGDACALPLHLHSFDAVLMANLLCRLPDPIACLERLQGVNALVNPGGVVMMTTPFSWLEEYTPRDQWLNGIEGVSSVLTEFELLHTQELPFLIREHQRKFEYIITQASVWRRRMIA